MIVTQSLLRSGFAVALIVGGSSLAVAFEGFVPPVPNGPTPTPTHAYEPVVPDGNSVTSGPVTTVDCNCASCRRRYRGLFGWFRKKADRKAAEAEGNAMCTGCNIHPEPPFGTSFRATMQAQVARGEAARMVLHQFDFVAGEATLKVRGRIQVQKIGRLALQNSFPIIIESSRRNPALDAARSAAVAAELARMPRPVPADRVIVGPSPARGLDGLDGELIHENLLRLTGTAAGAGQPTPPTNGAGGAPPR